MEELNIQETTPCDEYVKRQTEFNSFYLYLVIASFIIILCAIIVAIFVSVIIGVIMAIASVIIYNRFASDELWRKLGIRYRTQNSELSLVKCRAAYGSVYYLPRSLIWYEVNEICEKAFDSPENSDLREIYLPKTIKRIGADAFCECQMLEKICFEGDASLWEKIEICGELPECVLEFDVPLPTLPKKKSERKNK